jgi:hypothetical protein
MCKCNDSSVLRELFKTCDDFCGETDCCLKKNCSKFYYVKPLYPSTAIECEKKIINKVGEKTTCFLNKNKNLILDCIASGNYAPLSAILPSNIELSLYTEDGFPLYANSALKQLPVLSITDFYSVNLQDYISTSTSCDSNGLQLIYCFKLLAKYTSSVPSDMTETLLGNIVGIITITSPVC